MKVLIAGVKGQPGHDVMNELAFRGAEGIGMDVEEMDITNRIVCGTMTSQKKSDAAIHCTAYIAVDATEGNLKLYRKINTEGTRNIARVCKAMDIKMMHISTDYMFNGGSQRPWEPDDYRELLNVYGLTEYEGEIVVEQNIQKYSIMRIAWVSGANGKNFTKTMLRPGREEGAISVVNNQIDSPTYTYSLARLLMDMIQTDRYRRYHATNEGLYSRYKLAYEIFRQADISEVKVTPVDSDGFPVKARRSSNSHMNKGKLTEDGSERLPSWQDALGRYLKVPKENGMVQDGGPVASS